MTLRLRYAVRSDVGHVREGNEDSAYAGARLVAVADGMGGHAAGEVASSTVIQTLAALDDDAAGGDLLDALSRAVLQANSTLRTLSAQDIRFDGMGTTITALLSAGGRLGLIHVGDSRAYLFRDGELEQLTHDHTLVQDLVDVGRITADQAKTHPQRSLLTRALDGRAGVHPDVSVRQARLGDRYVLCTDGLSSVVSDETIAEALRLPDPQAAADRLVELALRGGGPDNVTVVVADIVDETDHSPDSPLVAGAAAESRAVDTAAPMSPIPQSQATSPAAAARKLGWMPRRGTGPGEKRAGSRGHTETVQPPHAPGPPATKTTVPLPVVDADAAGAPGVAVPGHPPSAGLTPPPAAGEPAAGEKPSFWRRRRWWIVTAAVLLLLAGALVGFMLWVRTQYYVGASHGNVAIYRGIDASVLGVNLHSVDAVFDDLPVSSLPPYDQQDLESGYAASTKQQASSVVDRLRADRDRAQPAPPLPLPVPSPSPSPSASPSASRSAPVAGRTP
ncbi:MAG: protein phosphatase 2C domain-containing protein [Frankiaceae bacterium]